MALVTVVMAAYNAAEHIVEAIDSVLNQSFRDFELLVVDDGSTDGTPDILRSYGDRIRVHTQLNSGSPAAARNSGIRHANSKYVAFFDADDVMERDQLLNSSTVLERAPDVCLCFSNFQPFGDVADRRPWFQREHVARLMAGVPTTVVIEPLHTCDRPIFDELIQSNYVHTSTVMIRRDILLEHHMFDESLFSGEDWDLWLRLAKAGCRFGYCSRVMSQYRIQSSSVSRSAKHHESIITLLLRLEGQITDPFLERILASRLTAQYRDQGWARRCDGDYRRAIASYSRSLVIGGRMLNRDDVAWAASQILKTLTLWMISPMRLSRFNRQ